MKMLRVTAIAKSFSDEVKEYVERRKVIENKTIKLVQYEYQEQDGFTLKML